VVKFADDTTVVGLILGNDKTLYKEEVQREAEAFLPEETEKKPDFPPNS